MAKRRNRSDSVGEQVKQYSALESAPPDHVHLRDRDWPFWRSIVRARATDSWTDSDLECAANLARCKADIEKMQKEIDDEGDVVVNQRGTQIVNPKHSLLETLSRRAVALSRMLHVHAEATQGRARDTGERTKAEKQSQESAAKTGDDPLIAPPVH